MTETLIPFSPAHYAQPRATSGYDRVMEATVGRAMSAVAWTSPVLPWVGAVLAVVVVVVALVSLAS